MSKAQILRIGSGVTLPAEAVTETFAMLAKRGGGKSNAAVVMAEEMTRAGYQWVAIDPKGDWWGVRSDEAGTGPGLSVPVFGGRHGDIPLEATAGKLLAQLVVERDLTCVLDVSLFSKTEQRRFVTDFAEALFKAAGDDPAPRHLFLEEAEEFLPQRVDAGAARMVGAYSKIAKQGRTLGLGVTLITQRSASLNKDALSQTETLILFRTTSPHDRKAVTAWAEHHGEQAAVAESLSVLSPGESWILSPGFLGTIRRVTWRRRSTFDSGATPGMGARRREPSSLADIDLGEIKELMAETIEKAKADDPKLLRKRIADLERELADRPDAEPTVIEIEVAPPGFREAIDAWHLAAIDYVTGQRQRQADSETDLDRLHQTIKVFRDLPAGTPPGPTATMPSPRPAAPSPPAPRPVRGSVDGDSPALDKAQRAMLSVLAQHPAGISRKRLAFLAGYNPGKSTVRSAIGALRTAGYATDGEPIRATVDGLEALGPVEALPTGPALVDHFGRQLDKAQRSMLDAFIAAWPEPLSRDELAARTGYDASKSTFRSAVGRLRSLELVTGWAAADDLMGAIHG